MREQPKASRLEILGAWLRLWTPPRDVEIPPIPWRKVAIGAGVLVLLGVVTALVVAPAIDDAKQRSAAEERRAEQQRAVARRARLREEQRAIRGALPVDGATRGRSVALVESAIGEDAARRFDANGRPASCETAPGQDGRADRVVFDCFVTVREIRGAADQEGARGSLAIPYRAALEFPARRFTYCKANPRPGEAAVAAPEDVVPLPEDCRLR